MLIIAIPKSASTALAVTLSAAHDLPLATRHIRDEILLRRPVAPGYRHVARFHRRDFVELDSRVAAALAEPDTLAKFHFPPTPRNQAVLRDVRKVILLRDAEEIVTAYRRGEETGAWPSKSYEFAFCLGEESWQRRARETGLLEELRAFADGWRAHEGDKLVLDSSELIREPARALASVEGYLGLRPSGLTELQQARYSRPAEVAPRSVPRILWARRGPITKRLFVEANRLIAGNSDWADALFEKRRKSRAASPVLPD